eukprot:gb/GFBE01054838.1/.p1 GENE.gb/GFBE01054838.1/~~gb/GFBE01054838.1/.p1  ORF type:complete len:456 (+),score=101.66 gb/GFBE01054838.1/:1-1368(+)
MGCGGSAPTIPESKALFQRYTLGKKLGEGAFGQVRLAIEKGTKEEFAVKVADCRVRTNGGEVGSGALSSHRMKSIEREISMWTLASESGFEHINLIVETFFCSGLYYTVCEVCKGDLMQSLLQVSTITEAKLAAICSQAIAAIRHLHALTMVHRDVKPENFLWGGPDGTVLKLCDFGLAILMPKNGKKITGINGTAPYMAPEMLNAKSSFFGSKTHGYGLEVDLWALGVMIYLVLFCQFPYMPAGDVTSDTMKAAIKTDNPPLAFPETLAVDALSFVRKLLVRSPFERITAEEATKDHFLQKFARPSKQELDPVADSSASITAADFSRHVKQAKEVAERLRDYKVKETMQRDLTTLLKMVTTKSGGEWFSEGDGRDSADPQVQSPVDKDLAMADWRIKKDKHKKASNREKFGTHSGVVSEANGKEEDGLKSPCSSEGIKMVQPLASVAEDVVERL